MSEERIPVNTAGPELDESKNAVSSKINFLVSMLTGKDNKTHDVIRWGGLLSIVSAIIYEGYIVFSTGAFDAIGYATGLTVIIGGVGAGLKIKETTEPNPD